ncbi:MAG: glycosyl hydrolase family 18 protein [Phycisphaerales bacterium]|nr:glycosyl hydrolase family 18 protein [Phycisphaerales bacterium]
MMRSTNSLIGVFISLGGMTPLVIASPDVRIEQVSSWDGAYTATVFIENPADQPLIDGWALEWISGPDVASVWSGVLSIDGSTTTVSNASWNGVIAPGGSTEFGMTINGTWPPDFPALTFNDNPIMMGGLVGDGGNSGNNGEDENNTCPQDINDDDVVDVSDLLLLIHAWGDCANPEICAADINGDETVAIDDLTALLAAFGDCPGSSTGPTGDQRIIAYYIEWGIYGRDFQPSDIPVDKITHLNYAFANIDSDGRIAIGDPYAAIDKAYPGDTWDQPYRGTYNQINNVLKSQYPHLKTLISVGGWTWSGRFSDVALTEVSRTTFAESCVEFIRTYNFDGVDIDWEYPVCCGLGSNTYRPEDRENYTLLMEELRDQLDTASEEDGRTYLLTIAAAGGIDKLENYDLAGIADQCDWINTMSYDFMGAWDLSIAGHHAGLEANPDNPSANENVRLHYNASGSVQPWLNAGVSPDKVVMGVPFYGRAWGGVPSTNGGLFQSASSVPPGTWDDWSSGATGINDYFEIEAMLQSGNYTRYWDDQAKVPWLYSPTEHGGHFISYDDEESLQHKVDFVQQYELGGVMIWEITADRNGGLLDVLQGIMTVP